MAHGTTEMGPIQGVCAGSTACSRGSSAIFRHGSGQAGAWPVPLDITHEDDSVVVKASIPGIKPDEVEVTIEDGRMTIEGKTAVRKRREPGRVRRPREAHRQVLQGDTPAGDGRRRRGGVRDTKTAS